MESFYTLVPVAITVFYLSSIYEIPSGLRVWKHSIEWKTQQEIIDFMTNYPAELKSSLFLRKETQVRPEKIRKNR